MFIDDDVIDLYQSILLTWYYKNKRIYPWRYTYDPYKVLIAEIMLQQTNADKVIAPYLEIIKKCKNIKDIYEVDKEFLKNIFRKIGLINRAERLKNISEEIIANYSGLIPESWDELISFKGIGMYTCSAVLSFGFNKKYAVVDTNVIRIFERIFDIKSEKSRARDDSEIWQFAQILMPDDNYIDYNYAVLDFGALVCTYYKPKCRECVFRFMCYYFKFKNQ